MRSCCLGRRNGCEPYAVNARSSEQHPGESPAGGSLGDADDCRGGLSELWNDDNAAVEERREWAYDMQCVRVIPQAAWFS